MNIFLDEIGKDVLFNMYVCPWRWLNGNISFEETSLKVGRINMIGLMQRENRFKIVI